MIPLFIISAFAGCSNSVRRSSVRLCSLNSHQTGRRSSPSTSRKMLSVRRRRLLLRCVAERARVRALHAPSECMLLHPPQDRCRAVLRLWARSRRLSTSTPRALHDGMRLVRVGSGSEERGRAARAMCACVSSVNYLGRPVAELGCMREPGSDLGCSERLMASIFHVVSTVLACSIGPGRHTPL